MNALVNKLNETELTMTSQEIAELVGKRHGNVMRDIRNMFSQLGEDIDSNQLKTEFLERINDLGAKVSDKTYLLTKDESLCLVAGYSATLRMIIIKRWRELEEAVSTPAANLPNFNNPAAAARAWAEQYELGQTLAIENKQQQEKINSLESLFRHGMTIPQFCKMLNGVNTQLVCAYLEGRHWLFNESKSGNNKRWRVASYARDKYLTEEQTEISNHGDEPFIKFTPVLLRKGAARLHQLYLAGELPMKKNWDGLFTQDKELKEAA